MPITQAPFKYFGAKWRIAPWIIGHFGPHAMYVEPFGGSAAVLLQKAPSSCEVYNDMDKEVYTFFKVARNPRKVAELRRRLELTIFSRDEFLASYGRTKNEVERARRFFVRACMGAGGVGATRETTTGFWGMRGPDNINGNSPAIAFHEKAEQIGALAERLYNVIVENRPALDVIRCYDTPETLFYLDPPYVKSTCRSGEKYRCDMKDDDHRALAEVLHHIKGKAIISGYDCALYQEAYADWDMDAIGNNDYVANRRRDCLWIKPGSSAQARLF